jgi:hypothetical protein
MTGSTQGENALECRSRRRGTPIVNDDVAAVFSAAASSFVCSFSTKWMPNHRALPSGAMSRHGLASS